MRHQGTESGEGLIEHIIRLDLRGYADREAVQRLHLGEASPELAIRLLEISRVHFELARGGAHLLDLGFELANARHALGGILAITAERGAGARRVRREPRRGACQRGTSAKVGDPWSPHY